MSRRPRLSLCVAPRFCLKWDAAGICLPGTADLVWRLPRGGCSGPGSARPGPGRRRAPWHRPPTFPKFAHEFSGGQLEAVALPGTPTHGQQVGLSRRSTRPGSSHSPRTALIAVELALPTLCGRSARGAVKVSYLNGSRLSRRARRNLDLVTDRVVAPAAFMNYFIAPRATPIVRAGRVPRSCGPDLSHPGGTAIPDLDSRS